MNSQELRKLQVGVMPKGTTKLRQVYESKIGRKLEFFQYTCLSLVTFAAIRVVITWLQLQLFKFYTDLENFSVMNDNKTVTTVRVRRVQMKVDS